MSGAALDWAGGFRTSIAGITISARSPERAYLLGLALVAAALVHANGSLMRRLHDRDSRAGPAAALALALAALVVGAGFGTHVAGGPDPYGYVSQARLWQQGSVIAEAPLSGQAGWVNAAWALTPLGYLPAARRGYMVPQYPAGFPLTMALAGLAGGEQAMYLVVPVFGAVAIWLIFLLGRDLAGPAAGLLAAVWLAACPPFLLHLVLPMSDVPAMTLWLLGFRLAWTGTRGALAWSGLATAIAITVRPNLAPLAFVLAAMVITRAGDARTRAGGLLTWGGIAAIGPVFVLVLNAVLYGGATRWGYDLRGLFSIAHVGTNLRNYSAWLWQTRAWVLGLALPAPFVWREGRTRRLALWSLALVFTVLFLYVGYVPFSDWTFLRFLLPAFPFAIALAAGVAVTLARRATWGPAALAAAAGAVVVTMLSASELAFTAAGAEGRYVHAAAVVHRLPEDALVIANLHSGSVRYYADRLTLRYEWLGAKEYNEALMSLRAMGRTLYALLDEEEVAPFRMRYAAVADLSWLDAPPMAIIDGRVLLYRLPR